MNAFVIYVLILTGAYLIYYGVMIARDVIANHRKRTADSTTETFTIFSSASPSNQGREEEERGEGERREGQEQTVMVAETANGFTVGVTEVAAVTVKATPSVEPATAPEATPAQKSAEQIQEELDKSDMTKVINVIYQQQLDADDYMAMQQNLLPPIDNGKAMVNRIPTDQAEPIDTTDTDDDPLDRI